MRHSAKRILLTTSALMRGNRVLIALLLLWPCLLSAILIAASHNSLSVEDVQAILQQELFYGLALVGLGGSTALGAELRAHRVQGVLGRAVGRAEYLLALGASAFVPFAGYVLVLLGNAVCFVAVFHATLPPLAPALACEFAAGVLVCAVGLLFSVLLPQVAAAVATGVVLGLLFAAGTRGGGSLLGAFAAIEGRSCDGSLWIALGAPLAAALLAFGGAAAALAHKDLKQL